MKNYKKDLTAGLVIIIFGIFYFSQIGKITMFGSTAEALVSARTVPYLWVGLLLFLAILLVVRSLIGISKVKNAGEQQEKTTVVAWFADNYAVVGTFIILGLYAGLMRQVGYLLDTFFYLIIQIPLLTQKSKINKKLLLIALIIAVVFSLVTDYLFVKMLNVPLPKGLLGF